MPERLQTSEFVHEHGFLDAVYHRKELPDGELAVAGMDDFFEIWGKELWDAGPVRVGSNRDIVIKTAVELGI